MLFHGLDAVEPGLRWIGTRKATHIKEKRAYLTYTAPAGAAAGNPVDGLPLTVCGPGVPVEMGAPCYIECCGFGEIRLKSQELKNGGQNIAYCKERNVFTVDFGGGSRRVDNDEEWWLAVMGGQLLEILAQRMVAGDGANTFANTTVPNDSDGLYKYLTQLSGLSVAQSICAGLGRQPGVRLHRSAGYGRHHAQRGDHQQPQVFDQHLRHAAGDFP